MSTFEKVLAKVSKAEWIHSEESEDKFWDFARRSPWYDVQSLLPQPPGAMAPFPKFKEFPAELVLEITQFLPPESVKALALTCKSLRGLVRKFPTYQPLSKQQDWRLLLLLERDYPSKMACHICFKLHSPHCPTDACYVRLFRYPRKRVRLFNWKKKSWDIRMPQGLTYTFCRLVMRRYLWRQPYDNLLLLHSKCQVLALPDIKLSVCTDFKIVDGHLLYRCEVLVAPFPTTTASRENEAAGAPQGGKEKALDGPEADENAAPKTISGRAAYFPNIVTNELALNDFLYAPITCRHQSAPDLDINFPKAHTQIPQDEWRPRYYFRRMYGFVTDHAEHSSHHHPTACYGPALAPSEDFRCNLTPTLECALLNQQPCRRPKEGDNSCKCQSAGRVRSCAQCFTDMCISAQDVPDVGRVMSLTRWTDLGGVTPDLGLQTFFAGGKAVPNDKIGRDGLHDVPRHCLAAPWIVAARFEGVVIPPGNLKADGSFVKESKIETWSSDKWWGTQEGPALLDSWYEYEPRIRPEVLHRLKNPDLECPPSKLEYYMGQARFTPGE